MSLLEALLAGAVHPTDGGLREHCAALVAEFLHWSIKQMPPGRGPGPGAPLDALCYYRPFFSLQLLT